MRVNRGRMAMITYDHPLLRFDNVPVSPRTAGLTRLSRRNIAKIAAE
jgi:phosphoglycerate dehydrogenase-like enzyme